MRLARPSTIWRALSLDLWRLLILTAGVVVAVGVFALTLRPLAEGRIGPAEAIKFMAFGALPMLQYALPFAAGFAATMAYHRLAVDNEMVASHAGGVSHRAMLVPAAAAGLILAGVLMFLADSAIPRLLRNMEEVLAQDIVRLVIAPIKRGEAIQFGPRIQLYADDVASGPPDEGTAVSGDATSLERYVLSGALAVEFDDKGAVIREASARTAYLWIYRAGDSPPDTNDPAARFGGTTVVFRLEDPSIRQPGRLEEVEHVTYSHRLPNFFNDDPKYHSWLALERVKREPERMNWIARQKQALAALLSEKAVVQTISSRLASSGKVRFLDDTGHEVILRAIQLGPATPGKGWVVQGPRGDQRGEKTIEVTIVTGEGRARLLRTSHAWLSAPGDDRSPPGTMQMRLEDFWTASVTVDQATGDIITAADTITTQLRERVMTGLKPFDLPAPGADQTVSGLLDAAAKSNPAPGSRLAKAAADLATSVSDLRREILSKQQERLAASVACLVMVLCGAIMAMRLRDSLPLPVYLWSFLPSLVTLLTISGGQRMTHNLGLPGLLLLWGGVAALAFFTFLQYRRLIRH